MSLRALVLASCVLGCGARTALPEGDASSDALEDTSSDVTADAVEDTSSDVDFDGPISEVACTRDLDCDDGVPCTDDRCDPALGRCRNVPVDARCDDAIFCNGVERCQPGVGCVRTPRACADSVSCTVDRCDETARRCVHTPDDALCPISHGCDATLGCQARALAHSDVDLYEIRLPSGVAKKIGPTGSVLTDVALAPDGTVWGVRSNGTMCKIALATGFCASVPSLSLPGSAVSLDAAPDGRLYGGSANRLYVLDPATGARTPFTDYPPGLFASGDLAFLGTRLLATARGGGPGDALVEFDTATGAAKTIGRIGFNCVWGLAAFGPTLYGLTCEGNVLRIDPTTGKGTSVSKTSIEFWGATAR